MLLGCVWEAEPSFRRQEKSLIYFEFIIMQRCLVTSAGRAENII
jgi:hypothetical protein